MPTNPTRRRFVKGAALASIASAIGIPASSTPAALAPIARVGGPHLLPAVNTYSFLELLNANLKDSTKGIDLFGVCDFAAKQNLFAVDLTGYFFPAYPKPPTDGYIARLKRHTHDLGLAISGTGVRNDFTAADKSIRAAGIQIIKDWIEVAAKLGAPVLRVFADSQPPFKSWKEASGNASREVVEAWMADALRECAEHAQKFGVIVAVQNHGDFIASGAEHLSLLSRVDHEWCGALVDTGKYMSEDPYADMAMMVPHAVNWQIKETLRSETTSPPTDFRKLVGLIRQGGYRGYLPIETLSMHRQGYDSFAEVTKVIAQLREAITVTA
ncbi:MAG TPA: sugar phosphate isomerase/epimerase family protein [Humisphaera sp.]|jgi:sugar phosphate isomerase/epimerase|nr:sugar phosphate isomerase/epimerase family protein [Humisphaera sp.]